MIRTHDFGTSTLVAANFAISTLKTFENHQQLFRHDLPS